jgi:23S rRNA (cytidine1920-2'-O)/16S rRNA (cytidine1409-2'-O)-methyltransferase
MSSSAGSTRLSAERRRIARAALVTHGRAEQVGNGVERLFEVARRANVELIVTEDEARQHGLEALGVDPRGKVCLDLGASTGGFTDCLLQCGAARVIALDVGYGQLHPRLRDDPRVTVLERVNARHLDALPFAPELITCDVSFISATRVLPPAISLAAPAWEALVLVKPQFEAGRADVPKGVVRDPEVHRRVLRDFCAAAGTWGARVAGAVDSGHPGPKGNREFVVHLIASEKPSDPDELERRIDAAVG